MFKGFAHWDLVTMLALMFVLTVFEFLGVFNARLVTITQIIKDFVPMPCRIMVCAWLCWHFVVSDIVRPFYPYTTTTVVK